MRRRLQVIHGADHRLVGRLGAAESRLLDDVLPRLSSAADHSRLWLAVAGGLALTGPRGRRAAARGLLSIAVASTLTNTVAKPAARRARPPAGLVPELRRRTGTPDSTSFPSGHSASALAFATGAAMEVPALALPLGPLAVAVAASRVVIGVHYPSDCVAGAALGIFSALITTRVRPSRSTVASGSGSAPRSTRQ